MPGAAEPREDEVVGFGSERVRSATRAGWVRRHPWVAGGVAVLLVAGAAVVVVRQRADRPDLPSLTTSRVVVSQDDVQEFGTTWEAGPDRRPPARFEIGVDSVLGFSGAPASGIEVLGPEGPGLSAPTARPAAVPVGAPTSVRLAGQLDCTQVPPTVDPSTYRLRVRVADGSKRSAGTVAAGAAGKALAARVSVACGSWRARHDLTVTAASAVVDPVRSRVRVSLTVDNQGTSPATLGVGNVGGDVLVRPVAKRAVPAGGQVVATYDVEFRDCDAATSEPDNGLTPPAATTADVLGVLGFVGRAPAGSPAPWLDSAGPTGIVLNDAAQSVVSGALRKACGGLRSFAALLAPSGASYDRAARLLTLRVQVDGTPGKITDLRLVSQPASSAGGGLTPLWSRTARLVPDRTGQVVATLRYRSPSATVCKRSNLQLPGFVIKARVPGPVGLRTVSFAQFVDPWQDVAVLEALCPGSELAP